MYRKESFHILAQKKNTANLNFLCDLLIKDHDKYDFKLYRTLYGSGLNCLCCFVFVT